MQLRCGRACLLDHHVSPRRFGDAQRQRCSARSSSPDRATSRTSMRRWWATRSRHCLPRSGSPIATRCGCTVLQRACTSAAAGRRSSCPRELGRNLGLLLQRAVIEFAGIASSSGAGAARVEHWAIMWGCRCLAITFPLAWGWIHFDTSPAGRHLCTFVFGMPRQSSPRLDDRIRDLPRAGLVVLLVSWA